MKKILKWIAYLVFLVFVLEVGSKFIIVFYLKNNISEDRFRKIFSKSNFFNIKGIFHWGDPLSYDLYELTHLKPNGRDINVNGYRGKRVNIVKPQGTIRVLCLGNSTTFGIGVSSEDSYPYLLEEKLRKEYPDKRIEVINGGVPGTHTIDAKRRFQIKFVKYKPDITLWRLSTTWLVDSFGLPKITIFDRIKLWIKTRIVKSYLVNLILIPLKPGDHFTYPNKPAIVPDSVKSDYDSIKLLAKSIGCLPIAVDYTRIDPTTGSIVSRPIYPKEDFIETKQAFHDCGYSPQLLFFDNVHLTELGNDILATAIFDYFVDNNILESLWSK